MQLTARQHRHLDRTCKEEAPTLYLDYLYYFNKAISEYNRYEVFETNQQLADDMRSWKKSFQASSLETPIKVYTKVYRAQQ
jgi:hypothetical protein